MFFCIGENAITRSKVGKGDTLEAAICDWAYAGGYAGDKESIAEEFQEYKPTVLEGKEIELEVRRTITIQPAEDV